MTSWNHKLFTVQLFSLLILSAAVTATDLETDETVSFRYGIMGKTTSQPDSLFRIDDLTQLSSGDSISINYRIKANSSFYVIIQSDTDEYSLFYSASMQRGLQTPDMVSASVEWIPLESRQGFLRIYLIGTTNALVELEDLMGKYQISSHQLRQKYARRVTAVLASVTADRETEYAVLPTRLQKPGSIGATFRGEYKEQAVLSYLFKQCNGRQKAVDVITIKHR